MSEIDWAALQKEASTAGVLPQGDYNIIVVSSEGTKASTGKPMIKWKARVTDGPQKDKTLYGQFVLSQENAIALRMFFNNLQAFGIPMSYFTPDVSFDEAARQLINRCAMVTLDIRQWQGSDRNDIKAIKPLGAGTPLPPGAVT